MQSHRKLCLFCGCTLYEVSVEVVELFMTVVIEGQDGEDRRDGGKKFFASWVSIW